MQSTKANVGARKSAHTSNPADSDSIPQKQPTVDGGRPNLGRHAANCQICVHSEREAIEDDFVHWVSADRIAREYGLGDRASVYRHAHALNLFSKRYRNLRFALGQLIEQVSKVKANGGVIVSAIEALAKINARGQLIEPDEYVELHELFDRMSPEEYEARLH